MNSIAEDDSPVDDFDTSVFVNCPFDEEYKSLLRPLLFTVIYLGQNPRISSERLDSAENRIDKICELIEESRYGIHDISRLRSDDAGQFYRLNMPFELGIDYGARRFGSESMSMKRCLILEEAPYDYKVALSDLSGADIKNHNNKPDEVVRAVRDWFYETVGLEEADYPLVIWYRFNDFTADLFDSRFVDGLSEEDVTEDIERMPVSEYVDSVREWVLENVESDQ
jgi:hypothetical protein